MRSQITKILVASMLATAACSTTPKLPDPSVVYPTPPAALMQSSQNLETIPLDNSI